MLYDGTAGSLSAEEERALQARGQELLSARRANPNAPQYTPEDAAALRDRGSSLLQAHQHQHQQAQRTPRPGPSHTSATSSLRGKTLLDQPATNPNMLSTLRDQYDRDARVIAELNSTITALQEKVTQQDSELTALRQAASVVAVPPAANTITVEEAEEAKAALLAQFSTHMEDCNKANQEYWAQTQAQHEAELATLAASRDALQARVEEIETELAAAQLREAERVRELEMELANARAQCQSLEAQCATLTQQANADVARLQDALTTTQEALHAAEQQLEDMASDKSDQAALIEEQLHALRHELCARDAAVAAAQEEVASTRQAQAAQATAEEALHQRIADLQTQVIALQQERREEAPSPDQHAEPFTAVAEEQRPADAIAPSTAVNPFQAAHRTSTPATNVTARPDSARVDADGWDMGAGTEGVWGAADAAEDAASATAVNPFHAPALSSATNPFVAVSAPADATQDPFGAAAIAPALVPTEPPAQLPVAAVASTMSADAQHLEEDIARLEQALEEERVAHTHALTAAQSDLAATKDALEVARATAQAAQESLAALESELAEARAAAQAMADERDIALAAADAKQHIIDALQAQQPPQDDPLGQPHRRVTEPTAALLDALPPPADWTEGWGFEDEGDFVAAPEARASPEKPAAPVLAANPFARPPHAPTQPAESTDPFTMHSTDLSAHDTNPFAVAQPTGGPAHPATAAAPKVFLASAPEDEAPVLTTSHAGDAEARVAELEAALQASDDARQDLLRRVAALEAGHAALDASQNAATRTDALNAVPVLESSSFSAAAVLLPLPVATASEERCAGSLCDDENAIPTSPSSIAIDDSRRPEHGVAVAAQATTQSPGDAGDEGHAQAAKPVPYSAETEATTLMGIDGDVLQLRERVRALEAQLAVVRNESLERIPSSVPTQPSARVYTAEEDATATSGMQVLGRRFADVQLRLARAQEENAALREEVNNLRQQCGLSPLVSSSDSPSQAAQMQPPENASGGLEEAEMATLRHVGRAASLGLATDITWEHTFGGTLNPVDAEARRASQAAVGADGEADETAPAAATVTSRRLPSAPEDLVEGENDAEEVSISVSTRAAGRRPGGPSQPMGEEEEYDHPSLNGMDINDNDEEGDAELDNEDDANNRMQDSSNQLDGHEETPTELPRRRTNSRPLSPHLQDATAESMAALGRQYAEAQHQLMRAVDMRAALEADLAEAQQQLAALAEAHEAELQELTDTAEARLIEVEDLCRQRIEELEAELEAARANSPAAQPHADSDEAPSHSDDHAHSSDDAAPAGPAVADLMAELDVLRQTEASQAHKIAELLSQREAAQLAHAAELHALKEALQAAEAEKEALEAEMDAMVDQFESQMDERDALLQQRLEEMEANTHVNDSDRIAELESARAASEASRQHLQERFQQLQNEYNAYVKDTHALRNTRDQQSEEAVVQASAVHDANARQLAALRTRLEEMSEHMDAAQRDLTEREAQCVELRRQLDQQALAHTQAIEQLKAQLEDRRREVQALSTHNDELTSLLQDGATSVEAALADRERELKALRADCEAHKRHAAELGDQLAQQGAALTDARAEQSSLQRAVADAEAGRREATQQAQAAHQAADRQAREHAQEAEHARLAAERAQREHSEELARMAAVHQEELNTCHKAADALRDELQVAQTMAATLPLEGRRFQNQFDALRQQLESALSENTQLQKILHDLRAAQVGGGADSNNPSGSAAGPARSADAHVNALLSRTDELEGRCRELTRAKNELAKDKDNLTVQALKAERLAEVKEQALRRQEAEVQYCRTQIASLQSDLGHRVRANQALQSELESVHDHAAAVAAAYEDLQSSMAGVANEHALAAQAEGLMYAKARSVPLLLEEYMHAVSTGYVCIARAVQTDRAQLAARCDAIEATAQEAMTEGERQISAYQTALADAQEEQTALSRIIDGLRDDLQVAEQGLAEAVEELKAARVEVRETKRAAHEEVFAAQREQQSAALEHADTLHSLALLQEEVDRAARILQKQKEQYEGRITQLEHDLEQSQDKLRSHASESRAARSAEDDDRAQLLARAEEAERRRDAAERDARGVRAQLDRAVPRLAALEEAHAQRSAELLDTAQQLSALSKKTSSEGEVTQRFIQDLSEASQELIAANAALKKTNVMHETALERLKAELGDVQHENEQLRVQRDQQARDLDTVTRRANELEVRYARDVTETQSRQRDLERHISGLQERNTHLQEGEQSARQSLRDTQQQLTSATDALARATEAHETTQGQFSRQLQSLRDRCAGLEAELAALQQQCTEAQTARDAKDRDGQAAQREADRLREYLAAANEHNEALNEQLRLSREEQTARRTGVQQSLEDAQKELQRCRQVLADAEAKQLGLESDLYAVRSERDKLHQELLAARAATQTAQEAYKKEQFERCEMASSLQDQVAKLYEELRAGQNKIRTLAAQLEQQRDQNGVLLDEVKEANERCKAQRVECECVKDELATTKEENRRSRYALQSKIDDLEDALESEKVAAEQYHLKMTNKVEMYEVTEAALRQEIADLRRDVADLEESLAAKARGEATSERDHSRQLLSLKNAEEELRMLRAQHKKDIDEISELRLHLQQRTTELERCTRELGTQAARIRAEMEAQHHVTVDTLTAQCRKAQQALEEARAGRDHAIQSSQLRQKQLEEIEEREGELAESLRARQQELELLRHRLQSIELVAQQAAQEAGLSRQSDASSSASVDVPQVLDNLLEQVRQYAHGATSTELERRQCDELRAALDEHQTLMQRVSQLAEQPFHVPVSGAGNYHNASVSGLNSATMTGRRSRTARGTSFLIEPLSRPDETTGARASVSGGAPLLTDGGAAAGFRNSTSVLDAPEALVWHPSQQNMVEQLEVASLTLSHRLQAHVHTTETALNTLAAALSAPNSITSDSAVRKVQLTATMLELQRRTGSANRALQRVVDVVTTASRQSQPDLVHSAATGGVGGPNVSALSGVSPIRQTPAHVDANSVSHSGEEPYAALTTALVEAVRAFGEVERVVLRPYNEILSTSSTSAPSGAAAAQSQTAAHVTQSAAQTPEAHAPATPGRNALSSDTRAWF